MKILLVRLRQIGDVVFTTPAIRALRERYPDAHLSYLVEPAAAPVVAANPLLSEVIVAPGRRGLQGLRTDLALGRRLRRQRYDIAIDFHGGPRASALTWLSGAPMRIGYRVSGRSWMYTHRIPRVRALRPRHSVVNQWDLLEPLGIPPADPERFPVEMPVDPQVERAISARLSAQGVSPSEHLFVLHVSAGNPFRRWPVDAFSDVAAALASRTDDARVIVTSGPSDAEAASRVIDAARARLEEDKRARVLACGEVSLAELRALCSRATLYVGGDSGPMHIAATSPVAMVSLYGPTLPARSAPWRTAAARSIAVEVAGLECRPCDQRVCAPGDFRCLTRIRLAQVVHAIDEAMR